MAEHVFKTVIPGGFISASDYNRLTELMTKVSTFVGPGLERGGFGVALPPPPERFLYARLTARDDSGDYPAYTWNEVLPDAEGGWLDSSAGGAGDAADFPAYEFNGSVVDITNEPVVVLYKGTDNYCLFVDPYGTGRVFYVDLATAGPISLATDLQNTDYVDGTQVATGDVVLVKDQEDQSENGVYVVVASGAATRALPFTAASSAPFYWYKVFVTGGSFNKGSFWEFDPPPGFSSIGVSAVAYRRVNDRYNPALLPVRAATTTNGTLATAYAAGQTIDGVTLVAGDRILIKNQTSNTANGVWVVKSSGAPYRPRDASRGRDLAGCTVAVMEGTTNADTVWLCTADSSITSILDDTTTTAWERIDYKGLAVRKNSTGSVYTRRRLNLIEGSGVTLTVADDPTDDEVDVTIAAAGAQGYHPPVRVASTAAGTLASSFENGDTLDGVTLATGDRILLKNQSAAEENGIYTVNASGAPTRAADADAWDEIAGTLVTVMQGTANADTIWQCIANPGGTLNVSGLSWTQVDAPSTADTTGLHRPCRCATTANVNLASGLESGDTIDGVTLSPGDRVLVKDQTSALENGIYVAVNSGAASRASDADHWDELAGSLVPVMEGTANADSVWLCTSDAAGTIGGTSNAWKRIDALRVRKNSAGTTYNRNRLNLIEGGGVTLTFTDDATNDEVDVEIAASVPAAAAGWVKVTKTYADLAAAATSNTINLYSVPEKGYLQAIVIKHSQSFSGGGLASYGLDLGYTGSLSAYLTFYDAFGAVSDSAFGGAGWLTHNQGIQSFTSGSWAVKLTANCGGANLNAATQGSVDVWLLVATLP